MNTQGMKKAILVSWLALLAARCAAPVSKPAAQVATIWPPAAVATLAPTLGPTLTLSPTPTLAPQPPLLLISWDRTQGNVVRAVDPATGQDAPGRAPIPLGGDRGATLAAPHALSANGRYLAAFDATGETCYDYAGGSACGPRSETLLLLDTARWQHRAIPLAAFGWVGYPRFDAGGERLAFGMQTAAGQTLMLLDASTGEMIAQATLDLKPSHLGFGPDGALVVYGQPEGEKPGLSRPGAPRVQLRDGETLAVLWEATLDDVTSGHWCSEQCDAAHGQMMTEMWWPGVALSADGETLFIVHADEDRLTSVDLAARRVASVTISGPQTRLGRLLGWLLDVTAGTAHAKGPVSGTTRTVALSADGARLYMIGYRLETEMDAAGNYSVTESRLSVQAIDTTTGMIVATSDVTGHTLRLSADGGRVFVAEWGARWPVTYVLDAQSLAAITDMDGPTIRVAHDVTGQPRLVGDQTINGRTMMSLLDPQTYAPLAEWPSERYSSWVTLP